MRAFVLLLFTSVFFISIQTCSSIRAQFSTGVIEGYRVKSGIHNVNVFKSVPFAEPPLGDLRFRLPQPKKPWHGIRDGTKYSRPCTSNTSFTTSPQKNVGEDCLYLNIFADERCMRKACPVLFYIHGGNFYYDSAVMFNDTGIIGKYASDEMIFVIPAYRLGIFGFMDLGIEFKDAPYNVGAYDLILALRWIQKEVHTIGGDPKKITCMGNSGGASAVAYLLVSPALESDIFDKVIVSSGQVSLKPHVSIPMTRLTLKEVNCDKYENGTELPIEDRLKCLKQRSTKELSDAARNTEEQWPNVGPQTDEILFPGKSYHELMKKYLKGTPMLLTTTTEEMVTETHGRNNVEMCKSYFSGFGYESNETVYACAEFYKGDELDNITRDTFHAMATELAVENTRRGQPTFVGIFAQVNHTHHANDMTYFFGLHPIANMTENDKLMDRFYPNMIKQFVKTGRPEKDWEPANEKGENYYYMNFELERKIIPHLEKGKIYNSERVDLWIRQFGSIEWNATHDSPIFQQLLQLPSLDSGSISAQNATQMFVITNSQIWSAFWVVLTLSIILATVILVITASRLMFTYQSSREWTLAKAGESKHILNKTVRKYV